MVLHVVRHAKAGSRSRWIGDDRRRPLTDNGWAQARALAEVLAGGASELRSSPFLRCVQTLEPLAVRLGRTVEREPLLAEASGFPPLLTLLEQLPEGSVLCSHGDVIPELIDALVRRGASIDGEPNWQKASRWELVREGGRIVSVTPNPPPAI